MTLLLGIISASISVALISLAVRVRHPRYRGPRTCSDGSCAVCRPWARRFGGRDG